MSKRQRINWPLVTKLVCTSLPSDEGKYLVSRWRHWQKHKGDLWLSNRIKSLWITALLLRSGDEVLASQVLSKNRIGQSGFRPRGSEGRLIQRFIEAKKPSVLRRLSAVLRFYTVFQLEKPTAEQLEDAESNITVGHPFEVEYSYDNEYLDNLVFSYHDTRPKEGKLKLASVSRLSGISAYGRSWISSDERRAHPFLNVMTSLCGNSNIPPSLEEYWSQQDPSLEEFRKSLPSLPVLGEIKVIPERGCKSRIVCSPDAWTQLYCLPFHDSLSRYIQDMEVGDRPSAFGVSCMFHQTRGADFIRNSIIEGKPTYCVDLSSATDNFPIEVQQWVLHALGWATFSRVIKELSGPYYPPRQAPQVPYWSYASGQPMGAYGSFPSFHLSHFVVLQSMAMKLGLDPDEKNFAVLGDDVIITNTELHNMYLRFLEEWDVPISYHKSFKGNVAEFAGFVAIKSRPGEVTIFRPYKWSVGCNGLPVLNTTFSFGSKVRKFSSHWSKAFDIMQRSMSSRDLDLSPLFRVTDLLYKSSTRVDPRYLSSLALYASFSGDLPTYDSRFDEDHIEFKLLQKDTESSALQYEGQIEREVFDPEQYALHEEERKRNWQNFYQDPLVAQLNGVQALA